MYAVIVPQVVNEFTSFLKEILKEKVFPVFSGGGVLTKFDMSVFVNVVISLIFNILYLSLNVNFSGNRH